MRHVFGHHVEQHDPLVQNLVVVKVVEQRTRHALAGRRSERPGAIDAVRSACGETGNEGVERYRILLQPFVEQLATEPPGGQQRKHREPSASGNQPPSRILITLAEKKAKSTTTKNTRKSAARGQLHFHSARTTTKARMVSIIIVRVTAMP
jgi:hypothetical protein